MNGYVFYRTEDVLKLHGLGTGWLVALLACVIAAITVAGLTLRARSHR